MTAGSEMERALPVEANFLEDWPQRPWVLAGLGLLAGLAVNLILEADGESALGAAAAAFCFFAFIAATFVLRPSRLAESAVFAIGLGLVMGGIAYFAADWSDTRAGTEFAFAAGVFFSLLAIPLFQANFHRKRWQTNYAETHFHVWTDAVSAGGAFAFVLLSWLVLWLLQALFSIVGIEFIEALIDTEGFPGAFMGAAFGGAMGVLRNQLGVLGTLQRVVMLVFALLAVPFAFALAIFLFILLTSGGGALWEATDSATPVLLTCAVAAFILTNAIIRDDDEARSSSKVMQTAALVLAACIFPLTVFAAISMGIRIDQHGLSPERIWALVAIVIATAYGLAYWVGLARGRMAGWSAHLRTANMRLAVASCAVAFVLAFPLFDFGAISTRDQIARLESGEVSVEEFDYSALRWDFGDAGRDALAVLAEGESELARLAQAAREQQSRPYDWLDEPPDRGVGTFVVYPSGSDLPPGLADTIRSDGVCRDSAACRVYLQDDGASAVALGDGCADLDEPASPDVQCGIDNEVFLRVDGGWRAAPRSQPDVSMSTEEEREALQRERDAIERGDVRIDRSQRRSIYIGGEEVGPTFEPPS
ncbi:DUF4153 domain-containing protein [Aurantiacibacter sp. MUD61]|uniref:DUF4153 domain-containing protein n=1 Tax=Aurantiacibacter sp. MUD61 TaxID=3009083 RepID=UPI0022F0DEB2|nr:DUF4153 domain-containing protein [Aurantiacibacter sp. MUD61]